MQHFAKVVDQHKIFRERALKPNLRKSQGVFGTEGWGFESLRVHFCKS